MRKNNARPAINGPKLLFTIFILILFGTLVYCGIKAINKNKEKKAEQKSSAFSFTLYFYPTSHVD